MERGEDERGEDERGEGRGEMEWRRKLRTKLTRDVRQQHVDCLRHVRDSAADDTSLHSDADQTLEELLRSPSSQRKVVEDSLRSRRLTLKSFTATS